MINDVLKLSQALSDSSRVRILSFMPTGELCVCQIVKVLGLAPSTVSKHLAILEQAGLLVSRKKGRWIHYQRPGSKAPAGVREALRWLDRQAAGDPQLARDRREAARAVRLGAEEICKIYQRRKGHSKLKMG